MTRTPEEIAVMAEAGKRLAEILARLAEHTKAGVAAQELDQKAAQLIAAAGGTPSFLGYRPAGAREPFPATLCVSRNEVVVHGIPSPREVIREGDLVKLDLGMRYGGFHVDAAISVAVPPVSREKRLLAAAAREALDAGIAQARVGNTLGDIGSAIASVVRRYGFSVAQGLTGHGIGRKLHEDPYVPNQGTAGEGIALQEGMVIAIEPMICAGSGAIAERRDGSFATKDGRPSSHWEHTVAITSAEPLVLTKLHK
ncbi:type I methionyl aminopeptidase [Candidatus Parcubacteria bacterium]|nr:MAG: type I methionyl aminopeptidase [Candidatus Parcubacteria bacterium]